MTQVKPSSFDIGRKSIPPSQPVSNLNMCYLHTPPRKIRISNIVCFLPLDLPNCNCTLHISPSLSGLSCDNLCHRLLISHRIIPHQHYFSNLKIPFWAIPFLTGLQSSKNFLFPSSPKLIAYVLNSLPISSAVYTFLL